MKGKKTYLAALGGILAIVANFLQGGSFGLAASMGAVQEVIPYLVAIFLRMGIASK